MSADETLRGDSWKPSSGLRKIVKTWIPPPPLKPAIPSCLREQLGENLLSGWAAGFPGDQELALILVNGQVPLPPALLPFAQIRTDI